MKRKVAKKAKRANRRALPRARPVAAAQSSSGDTTLLVAGLALVVLILGDTLFMTFSVRYLRSAG